MLMCFNERPGHLQGHCPFERQHLRRRNHRQPAAGCKVCKGGGRAISRRRAVQTHAGAARDSYEHKPHQRGIFRQDALHHRVL